jgi:alcohol dehydrogenase class IV
MNTGFAHEWPAQRVVFAPNGAATAVADEVDRLGSTAVMVIAAQAETPLADEVTAALPVAATYRDVAMHVPLESAERARASAALHGVDLLVSVGGGSTTGTAKAVALTSGIPIVAVPTTYAGSEATAVWGLTTHGRKDTGTDTRVLPRVVVYDAALTTSLPVDMSVASGLNALAHCVDSMWSPRSNPLNQAIAIEGIRALKQSLLAVQADPLRLLGREQMLYGAYLSGMAFSLAGSGLHHKICHVLGGMFNLPHAQTHAIVLPHVLAFNAANAAAACERIAVALGASDASAGLDELRTRLGAPRALRDYGVSEADLLTAVDAIVAVAPADNPTPVTARAISAILMNAWSGGVPS